MNLIKNNLSAILMAFAMLVLAGVILIKPIQNAFAGVPIGNSYQATTTSTVSPSIEITPICTTAGELGEITVTASGSAGGSIDLFNATTSNVLARTGRRASSTILIASIPSNATVGTYTFNASFGSGLLAVKTGTHGTTTISYRCN